VTATVAPTSAVPGKPGGESAGRSGPPKGAKLLKMLPLAPSIGLMLVFLAGPIIYCLYAAFTNMALTGTGAANVKFVGLANFRQAFGSSAFINSIWLTLIFTLVSAIIGQNTLGLGLALLMRRSNRLVRSLVGTSVIGAWVLPEVVAAYLLSAFLNSDGTLNAILVRVGLPGQDWLYGAPIIAVSIANIWRGTAFSMLVYSAALSEVPKEIEESAEMDGAAGARRLWWVTLPMISRAMLTNLMLITLQTLSVFGLIFAMTRGGPGTKSQTLPLYMYEQAFSFSQIGYGTAIALVMLAIGAVFSLIYLRGLNSEAA
jgi:multiple sugar transport system permease protein